MDPRRLAAIYAANDRVRREGTANLIAAARAVGGQRMIVQSMATWYRPVDEDPGAPAESSAPQGCRWAVESDPLWAGAPEPIGAAVRTVVEMETMVLGEMPVGIVLRYGAFYGPGTWYAPDGEMAARMRKRAFPVVGGGRGVTSFIHVDDAATAAIAALEADRSGVFNVVDDDPAPAAEWVPAYAAAMDAPRPLRVPAWLARLAIGGPLTAWVTKMRGVSNAAARTRLHWQPQYRSWRDGFPATLRQA